MKIIKYLVVNSILLACVSCLSDQSGSSKAVSAYADNIKIEFQFNTDDYKPFLFKSMNDVPYLLWMQNDQLDLNSKWQTEEDPKFNRTNKVKWSIYSQKPIVSESALLGSGVLLNPGDSIHIEINKNGYAYSGKGVDALKMQNEIDKLKNKFPRPTDLNYQINSLNDFLGWNSYLDNWTNAVLGVLSAYENKVSPAVYNWVKIHAIARIERQRAESFMNLNGYRLKNETPLTATDMVNICDSTLNKPTAQWLRASEMYEGDIWYFYQYNRIQVMRKFDFNLKNDSLNSEEKRRLLCYNTLKKMYKGQLRERLLQYAVATDMIKKTGVINPISEQVLKDYYNQPGFPEYKQWMLRYEDSMRVRQSNRIKS
jgi:hypothetical protein